MIRRTGIGNPVEVRCTHCGDYTPERDGFGRFLPGYPCQFCAGTKKVYSEFDRDPPPTDREMRRAERLGRMMVDAGWSQKGIEDPDPDMVARLRSQARRVRVLSPRGE